MFTLGVCVCGDGVFLCVDLVQVCGYVFLCACTYSCSLCV